MNRTAFEGRLQCEGRQVTIVLRRRHAISADATYVARRCKPN
jgi:hypothetical protein